MAKDRGRNPNHASPPAAGVGERSEPEPAAGGGPAAPGIEVDPRPRRRKHSAEYKARILRELDACAPGGIGAILRREGLYASQVAAWRKAQESGLSGKPGRRAAGGGLSKEVERLERQNRRLAERLRKAELIIDVQKKLCVALGLEPHPGLDAQ